MLRVSKSGGGGLRVDDCDKDEDEGESESGSEEGHGDTDKDLISCATDLINAFPNCNPSMPLSPRSGDVIV